MKFLDDNGKCDVLFTNGMAGLVISIGYNIHLYQPLSTGIASTSLLLISTLPSPSPYRAHGHDTPSVTGKAQGESTVFP